MSVLLKLSGKFWKRVADIYTQLNIAEEVVHQTASGVLPERSSFAAVESGKHAQGVLKMQCSDGQKSHLNTYPY